MNNCTITEILKEPIYPRVLILHGFGKGYTQTRQTAINSKVRRLLRAIQQTQPVAVVTIIPINSSSPIHEIETLTKQMSDLSTVTLYVDHKSIKVGKWYNNIERLGEVLVF